MNYLQVTCPGFLLTIYEYLWTIYEYLWTIQDFSEYLRTTYYIINLLEKDMEVYFIYST